MSKPLSRSDEQFYGYKQRYLERLTDDLELGQDENTMIKYYEKMEIETDLQEQDPEWQKDNMEYDLRTTDWILEKVRESNVYAQNLYAAICNNDFQKLDVIPILTDKRWGASWRHTGGIIAHMQGKGDYMNWYCSGIQGDYTTPTQEVWDTLSLENQIMHKEIQAYVAESVITDEIRADLKRLGWVMVPYKNE